MSHRIAVLRKYFDIDKLENRYQIKWKNQERVMVDTPSPGDMIHFILGLTTASDDIVIQSVDDTD